jgi:hypothetical protein
MYITGFTRVGGEGGIIGDCLIRTTEHLGVSSFKEAKSIILFVIKSCPPLILFKIFRVDSKSIEFFTLPLKNRFSIFSFKASDKI